MSDTERLEAAAVKRHPHDSVPDLIGGALNPFVLHDCRPDMAWFWDQWAVCHLRCKHGMYVGTAAGLNLLAAYLKAADLMNADHPQCLKNIVSQAVPLGSDQPKTYVDPCQLLQGHDGQCADL